MNARRACRTAAWITVVVLATVVAAHGEDEHAEVTIQGEIVDLACYIPEGARGEAHAKCAEACVRGGQPMGLLTSEGTVYVLFASHSEGAAFGEAKNHAGKQVEITGKPSERAGIKGLEVHAVKGL